ncbi:hypothetical protein JCM17823_25960 [Halorubrum gandharaense]
MSRNDGESPAADALARIVTAATGTEFDELAGDTRLVGKRPDEDGASAPVSHAALVLEDASSVIGVVPRADADLARRLLTAVDAGTEARLVMTGRANEVATGVGALGLRAAVADRAVALFAHDGRSGDPSTQVGREAGGDAALALLLIDDRALIGLFDAAGLTAVLSTTDSSVCGWVVECFERYREASSPLFD